mmetsp:Transcript_9291/g.20092  ORF Transcript_9291/g.20092 Transcript_9291/m.20092 type:complete len:342 (+) Transcript_9291:226-1251(+)
MPGNINDEELFTHLSLGQVFSRSINVFIDRFDVFMTMSAVVVVPAAIFGTLIGVVMGMEAVMAAKMDPDDPDAQAMDIMQFLLNHAAGVVIVMLLNIIVSTITTLVGEGAMVRSAADTYAAQPQGWFTCAKLAFEKFCSLLTSSLAVSACIWGGLLFCLMILGGALKAEAPFLAFLGFIALVGYGIALVYFLSSVMLIFPVIMVENKGPINAIRRSMEISEGRRCYLFCAIFIVYVAKVIVAQLLHNIFNGDNPLATVLSPAGILVSFIPDLLYLPINSIMKTVLYTSIRVDKEGLTQAVLQRELVEPTVYSPPNTDYRQVSLMEDSAQNSTAVALSSDFA